MSSPTVDTDERFWEFYLQDCRVANLTPTIRDYIVWLEEEGYDFDIVDGPDEVADVE